MGLEDSTILIALASFVLHCHRGRGKEKKISYDVPLCGKYWYFCVIKINIFTKVSKKNNSIFHDNINVHFNVQIFNFSMFTACLETVTRTPDHAFVLCILKKKVIALYWTV